VRLVRFDGDRIGAILGDLTDFAGVQPGAWPPIGMVSFIARYCDDIQAIETAAMDAPRRPLGAVRLECPVDWPNKLIAYPANYDAHTAEHRRSQHGLISTYTAAGQGFFLKANSSLSGPSDPIILPPVPDRKVHHECELAIIIDRGGRSISRDDALSHIFGYSCLVDVVIRGKEERVMRKSFDTFCPLGPWIVTADEIADPTSLELELTVNGEVRQRTNTRDLKVDIPGMIEMASSVMTLYPGDIIATGTPEGVGPIRVGDRLVSDVAGIGKLELDIVAGHEGNHSVWDKTSKHASQPL
jgi:2-keto-4-pentenoate hydratase/2-oxohepta-3-ene-1,7-dioic acid hydratase in catechol pathway|tara:strand:- start:68 stop:964 length:897 start_codon:yes stop_codon:yes gene_type:complete